VDDTASTWRGLCSAATVAVASMVLSPSSARNTGRLDPATAFSSSSATLRQSNARFKGFTPSRLELPPEGVDTFLNVNNLC